MAFATLLILLVAISSSTVALTEPLPSMANPRGFPEQRGRGRREGEREENPYVFHAESFRTRASSEAGEIRALPNFGEVSELLEGVERFRVTCIELKPNAVLLPHYIDAKYLSYVVRGRGYIAYLHQNELVKRNLEEGDVFGVPTGRTFYLVNSDHQNSLHIASILRTMRPFRGEFQSFYVAGGRNPQTVYSAFSDDVLQAAFNANNEQLERMFGRQKRGVIVRASEEQIRELLRRQGISAGSMSESDQPKPFNLRNQKPDFENENGRVTEAGPKDNPFLDSFDVSVGLFELNPGSLSAPFSNTKATSVVFVLNGEGRLEIACPHLGEHGRSGQSERGEQQIAYQKVRANLRAGTVYVVPAGHPVTEIASTNGRLQILRFDINADGNERQFLAGKNSVLQTLEREIRQISFDTPRGEEIEEVLRAQKDQVFLRGPQQQGREEQRSSA